MPLLTRQTLRDTYYIEQLIGESASGYTYRAQDLTRQRTVALKNFRPRLVRTHAAFDELTRPAMTASQSEHPHILTIYENFEIDSQYVLVQEWASGGNLTAPSHLNWTLTETTRHLFDCLDALVAAHSAGIVHGNLKPSNVLLDADQKIKLADFGFAVRAAESQPYLSPEQSAGEIPTARSDIYSLAIIFQEIVQQLSPQWQTDSAAASISPFALENFTRLLVRAAEKNPSERFANARTLRDTLKPPPPNFKPPVRIEIAPAELLSAPLAEHAPPELVNTPLSSPRPRRFAPTLLIGGIVIVLMIAAIWFLFNLVRPTPQVAIAPTTMPAPQSSTERTLELKPTRFRSPVPTPTNTAPAPPTATPNTNPIATSAPAILPAIPIRLLTPLEKSDGCKYEFVENNALQMRAQTDGTLCAAVLAETRTDAIFVTRLARTGGNGFGGGNTAIVFGYTSAQDYFAILFTRVGRLFAVARWRDGKPEPLASYDWSDALNRPDASEHATDEIQITIQAKQLILTANGQAIGTYSLESYDYHGGQIGVGVFGSGAQGAATETLFDQVAIGLAR